MEYYQVYHFLDYINNFHHQLRQNCFQKQKSYVQEILIQNLLKQYKIMTQNLQINILKNIIIDRTLERQVMKIKYFKVFIQFIMLKLAKLNFTVTTKQPIYIKSLWLNQDLTLQLAQGQDCLHLAIACGNISMCKEILNYHVENELIGNNDDDGYTHLMLLSMLNINQDTQYLMTDTKILNEISIQNDNRSVLTVIIKTGNIYKFTWYLQQIGKYPQLMTTFYQQLLLVYKGETIDKIAQQSPADPQIKKIIFQILQMLIPQALATMKKNLTRYRQQISTFVTNYTEKIQQYEKEYTINEILEIINEKLTELNKQQKNEIQSDSQKPVVKQEQPIKQTQEEKPIQVDDKNQIQEQIIEEIEEIEEVEQKEQQKQEQREQQQEQEQNNQQQEQLQSTVENVEQ